MAKLEDMVMLLGKGQASTYTDCKQDGMTLLHHAAFEENVEVVQLLRNQLSFFEEVVDENGNEEGWTPLTFSAQVANLEIAQILIESGAQPHQGKTNGTTALHYAAGNNDLLMIDYLLQ